MQGSIVELPDELTYQEHPVTCPHCKRQQPGYYTRNEQNVTVTIATAKSGFLPDKVSYYKQCMYCYQEFVLLVPKEF